MSDGRACSSVFTSTILDKYLVLYLHLSRHIHGDILVSLKLTLKISAFAIFCTIKNLEKSQKIGFVVHFSCIFEM